MPANLPPEYFEAEKKYRAVRGSAEKVAALQQMLSATPKHKGTDHLRAELRAKVARALEELERPKRTVGGPSPYFIRKEGAGQVALLGLPNVGKSQLLVRLTGAPTRVAPYPFTTQLPTPGMLRYQNVWIQLVDLPSINDRDILTRLFSLLRNSDLHLIVLDLTSDPLAQAEEVLSELDSWGYRILNAEEEADPEEERVQKRVFLVGNKADVEGTEKAFQGLQERYGGQFPIACVSAETGTGLDQLGDALFASMRKMRVYLKPPGGKPDYSGPLILDRGSNVEEVAHSLHKEWARKVKYALLWGSGKFDGQRVGRDYIPADGDVIELHA